MTDTISSEHRSWNMSQIKGENTKPEMIVRSYLHNAGIRFRLHDKSLPGKPDIILRKYKIVVFIDGCFWHRHKGCKFSYNPKSREEFWQIKFDNNVCRDKKVNEMYRKLPWQIIRIWECEINQKKLSRLVNEIKKN
jgi:DNA mismatch endonuclease (patch repair protein)